MSAIAMGLLKKGYSLNKINQSLKNKGIDKTYAYVILFLMLAITAYVIYEIFSGSPMESKSEMVRHATLQKIIVLINIVCMYFITYAFESKKTSSLVY